MFKLKNKLFKDVIIVVISVFIITASVVAAKTVGLLSSSSDILRIHGPIIVGNGITSTSALDISASNVGQTLAINTGTGGIRMNYSATTGEDVVNSNYLDSALAAVQIPADRVASGTFGANTGGGTYEFSGMLYSSSQMINWHEAFCSSDVRLKVDGSILARKIYLNLPSNNICTSYSTIGWDGTNVSFDGASEYNFDHKVKSGTGFAVGSNDGITHSAASSSDVLTGVSVSGGIVTAVSTAVTGLSKTISLPNAIGGTCTMTFTKGILTSTSGCS